MTAGAPSVVYSFDHGAKFITADADDDCHASVNLVYERRLDVVFIARQHTDARY